MAVSPQEADDGIEQGAFHGPVLLNDRYLIDPAAPLEDLDSPSAKAYMAEDRRDMGRPLFALICTPGLPVRVNAMAVLRGENFKGILPLVEWGALEWPPLGQSCMVVIFERPLGGRLTEDFSATGIQINEYDLPRRVIEPLSTALVES